MIMSEEQFDVHVGELCVFIFSENQRDVRSHIYSVVSYGRKSRYLAGRADCGHLSALANVVRCVAMDWVSANISVDAHPQLVDYT